MKAVFCFTQEVCKLAILIVMLILVIGLPGSGKSSVARMLANELGAIVLNSDVTRRELFPESRDYSSKETQAVIQETERRTREALKKGHIVILDALFTKQRPRDEYRKVAEDISVPFKLISVIAPESVIKKRMEQRQKEGDASEATFDYYLDRKPHVESIRGTHFTVNNKGDLEELEFQVRQLAEEIG
jgi:predicted kinase